MTSRLDQIRSLQDRRAADYQERLAAWSDIQDHLPYLAQQARRRRFAVELGVRQGNSTAALRYAAAAAGGHLWSVDINPPDVPLWWLQDPVWSFCQTDSTSTQAQVFLPPVIDLLFIDTSHTYAHTLAELQLYGPRMRRGGLIACHDTQWDEGDVSLPAPGGPVSEALDTYCDQTGRTWRNRASGPGFYGLGIIWT